MMKILITGGSCVVGQALIRSALHADRDVAIVAVDDDPMAPGLQWADSFDIIASVDDDRYIDRLEQVLAVEQPDAVLIGTDAEVSVLARHRQRLEAIYDTRIVVSTHPVVDTARDKWETHRFLARHDIDAPRCCLPGDEDALCDMVGFPLIVKPRYGSGGRGVRRVDNYGQLRAALLRRGDDDLVIQEYVGTSDDEYTAGALVFNGVCRACIVMRRIQHDGITRRAFVESNPELHARMRQVAECFRAFGPIDIQFRLHDGDIKIFDVNPRFAEVTFLRNLVGFNEVELTLGHLFDDRPARQPLVEPVTLVRHWAETVMVSESGFTGDSPPPNQSASGPSGARIARINGT